MSNVRLRWTIPASIPLIDVVAIAVQRDGVQMARSTDQVTTAAQSFLDVNVPNGDHKYTVTTETAAGISALSNEADVTIAVQPPVLPEAVSDLTASIE